MPQFYKENLPYVELCSKHISQQTAEQYALEERSLLRKRYKLAEDQIREILDVMRIDRVSTDEHRARMREELAQYHHLADFRTCTTMGDILDLQLKVVLGM